MEALKRNHQKIISLNLAKKIIIILVAVLFFDFLLFPAPSLASQVVTSDLDQGLAANIGSSEDVIAANGNDFDGNKLPESNDINVKWSKHLVITAYNSEASQTDGSPCIAANNFNVCDNGIEDTIAANFLPFGSKVKIPQLFGDRIFIVRDRMNRRHAERVDVWMVERTDAIKFGVKKAKIEVLE